MHFSSGPVGLRGPGAVPLVPVGHLGSKHGPPCSASDVAPKLLHAELLRLYRHSLGWLRHSVVPHRSICTPSVAPARSAARGARVEQEVSWRAARARGDRVRRQRGRARRRRVRSHTNTRRSLPCDRSPARLRLRPDGVALPWPRRPSARRERQWGRKRVRVLWRRPEAHSDGCMSTGL